VVNLAADRIKLLTRERAGRRLWNVGRSERVEAPDIAAVLDLRAALMRLPERKRACVVLRHYYGLSERETAQTLGIAVGTVKSQTSRGLEQLVAMLGDSRTRAPGSGGAGHQARTEGATG
jgi:DNA-directed RNA polymerase specialized sigma24 family protein